MLEFIGVFVCSLIVLLIIYIIYAVWEFLEDKLYEYRKEKRGLKKEGARGIVEKKTKQFTEDLSELEVLKTKRLFIFPWPAWIEGAPIGKLLYGIPFVVLLVLTVLAHFISFLVKPILYLIQPAFFLGRWLDVDSMPLLLAYYANLVLYMHFILKYYDKRGRLDKYKMKYTNCPYEDSHSMRIYLNWKCDSCRNYQGKDRLITEPCLHCNNKLKAVYCEVCHREVRT